MRRRRGRDSATAQPEDLSRVQVDVRDLAGGVDSGVGATGDDEGCGAAEDSLQGGLERALNCAERGLARPAAEVRAVVSDVEPDAHLVSLVPAPRRESQPWSWSCSRGSRRPHTTVSRS